MGVLEQIMDEVEGAKGPLTKKELARRVGVEESALDGMLQFLERKGRLSVYTPSGCAGCDAGPCVGCVFAKACGREEK
jgi:Mn-dependent DtxR family transcriptional regulator